MSTIEVIILYEFWTVLFLLWNSMHGILNIQNTSLNSYALVFVRFDPNLYTAEIHHSVIYGMECNGRHTS